MFTFTTKTVVTGGTWQYMQRKDKSGISISCRYDPVIDSQSRNQHSRPQLMKQNTNPVVIEGVKSQKDDLRAFLFPSTDRSTRTKNVVGASVSVANDLECAQELPVFAGQPDRAT